jgi:hypothetical protein
MIQRQFGKEPPLDLEQKLQLIMDTTSDHLEDLSCVGMSDEQADDELTQLFTLSINGFENAPSGILQWLLLNSHSVLTSTKPIARKL